MPGGYTFICKQKKKFKRYWTDEGEIHLTINLYREETKRNIHWHASIILPWANPELGD